nr:AAA family ATPase [Paenibacillus soyae]
MTETQIDGYGQLHNRRLDLDAPVIVVHGPNEAGKSTLLGYLRAMLYGFARRSNPAERGEPLRGGRHGGRLEFRTSAGSRYALLRHADEAGGRPRIRPLEIAGSEGDSGILQELILEQKRLESDFLGHIPEKLYRGLFAVTLTELHEVGMLSGEELGRHLYQAGWEDGAQIAAAEKELAKELDALFRPRGTSQKLNAGLKALEQTELERRKLTDDIDRFNELRRQEAETEEALADAFGALPEIQAKLRALRRASSSRPAWMRMRQLAAERKKFVYTEALPSGAEEEWTELRRKREEALALAESLRQERRLLERQIEGMVVDEAMIGKAGKLEAALHSGDRMRSLNSQLAEWRLELQSLDETIGRLVAGISPEWTERQLREMNVTVAERDFVRESRDREQTVRRAAERLQAELESLRDGERELASRLHEADRQASAARERLNRSGQGRFGLYPDTKMALSAAWNTLEEALQAWEVALARDDAGRNGRERKASGGSGLTIAGCILVGAGAMLGIGASAGMLGDGGWLSGVLAIAFVGAGAGLLFADRSAGSKSVRASGSRRNRMNGMAGQSEERDVLQAMLALAKPPVPLDAEHWMSQLRQPIGQSAAALRGAMRPEVQERLDAIAEADRARLSREESESRLNRQRQLIEDKLAEASAMRGEEARSAAEWSAWIAARGLPETMSHTAALEAFDLAEKALDRLGQYDRISAKADAAKLALSEFASEAGALCEGYAEAENRLREDPLHALQILYAEVRKHQAASAELRRLTTMKEEAEQRLADVTEQLEAIERKAGSILQSFGSDRESDYEHALAGKRSLTEIDGELTRLEAELSAGHAKEELEAVESLLSTYDEQELAEQSEALKRKEASLTQTQRELLERKGVIKGELERMFHADERTRLLAKREMVMAGLDADMERYAVLSIAKALIEQTKRTYEEERQPVVLRHASRYLGIITEGKYVCVSAASSKEGLVVEDRDRNLVSSAMLSRGTAEQLYLAMRLALAKEASQEVMLPLLLDDLFVNFDSARLKAASKLLAELSVERQIIFFTCHERTRDLLMADCKGAKLVELARTELRSGSPIRNSLSDNQEEPAQADQAEHRI